MNNIMVDLETLDTVPTALILSIGAVAFTDTGAVLEAFEAVIDLQSCVDAGLTISSDTVNWWLNQSPDAQKVFTQDSIPLGDALMKFGQWVHKFDHKTVKMWGNGASFDNAILANGYRAMSTPLPWMFYNDRCYRTLKAQQPHIRCERTGVYHNALDDAKTQMNHLFKLWGLV